jgi:outer membrane biosynthesis protein TonB
MIIKNKALYWGLIFTFAALYLAVAFVSTLHAITFFQLANTLGLAILLGSAYEIGQASVLFSILMTENKNRFLAWLMMILLTSLQVTANVYASFKFMDGSGSNDWTYWQRAILFAVQAENAEMYKVIISWISGALLPLVALGMTALVAENIRMARGENLNEPPIEEEIPTQNNAIEIESDRLEQIIENEVEKRIKEKLEEKKEKSEINEQQVQEPPQMPPPRLIKEDKEPPSPPKEKNRKPINPIRGWHFMAEYVDDNHDVFRKGKFIGNDPAKTPNSKKA